MEDRFVVGTNSTGSGGAHDGSAGNHTTVFPVATNTGDLFVFIVTGLSSCIRLIFSFPHLATQSLQSASNTADEITVHVIGILQHSNFVLPLGGTFTGNIAMTGDLTVDNTLKVDSSNNRVGGRNDPQTILDIAHSGSSNLVQLG